MSSDYIIPKIQITAYSDSKRKKKVGSTDVVLKDESFRRIYNNQFKKYRGINISGRKANYSFTQASQVKLTLMFDNTGIFEEFTDDVTTLIDKFLKLCFNLAGDIHEPRYLNILWGKQDFDCRLQTVDVKYTLFNKEGIPLRGEVEATFIEDVDDQKRAQLDNLQSPDLTHLKTVKEGDTLPLLTEEVYGDPKYYIHVAKANKLNNFRDIKPGQQLFFPPVKSNN